MRGAPDSAQSRLFSLRRRSASWRQVLIIVRPETVVKRYSTGSGSDRAPCREGVSMWRPVATAPGTVPMAPSSV